jgi:hypothetical protein
MGFGLLCVCQSIKVRLNSWRRCSQRPLIGVAEPSLGPAQAPTPRKSSQSRIENTDRLNGANLGSFIERLILTTSP